MAIKDENQYCDLLTPIVCDGCDNQNDVTNYCLQCNANICGECTSTHWDTRLHRDHIVLPRTHPEVVKARRSIKVFCPDHVGKDYVTYCIRCDKPCCASCITEKHNGHEFTDLEKKISQTESKIDEIIHDMETNWIPNYEKSISQLGKHMEIYARGLNDVKRISKKRLQDLIQQLFKTYEAFINEVDKHGERDMKSIERQKRELEANLEKVKTMVQKGKIAPVAASLFIIFEELSKVSGLRPSKITCPGEPSFTMSTFQFPSGHDIIGNINNGSEKVVYNAASDDQRKERERTSFDPLKGDVKVLKKMNGIHATSIVNIPNEEVWIYDDKSRFIDMYDGHFNKTKRIKVRVPCKDMTLYGRNEVIAIAWDHDKIVKISRSSNITDLCSRKEGWCNICVNSQQDIVVGVEHDDEDCCTVESCPWGLTVYSLVESLVQQEMDKNDMFWGIHLTQIRQTASGEYVVAIDREIRCISVDLKICKWTYTFALEYYSSDISCLCCDQYNNILVGDRKMNKIVMLNIEGQRVRTLLTKQDGICKPLSMDIDSKGRLWIGQEENVLIAAYSN